MMSLKGEERKEKILEILDLREKVTVNELSRKLGVSTETIRRYLEQLERAHKVRKVYGGAIRVSDQEPALMSREVKYLEEKKRIGKKAAEHVLDNDVIAIDEGSTPLHMIPYLSDKKNITVITNSFPAAYLLIEKKNNQLFDGEIIFLGGVVHAEHQRISGSYALSMMEHFYVNKAFITVDGISKQDGVTCYDNEKGMLSKKMMSQAEQSIVVVDHSKFDVRSMHKLAALNDIHTIISDQEMPRQWISKHLKFTANWVVAD